MTGKRFTHEDKSLYIDDDYFCELEDGDEITELLNRQQYTVETVWKENEQLKQQLSHIRGQLVMLDNCDNWDYNRMKYTVREIAEIMGYGGTINPKM